MKNKYIIVGADLSLVKTGLTIITGNGKVLYSGLVKSKPSGDKPIDETKRIVKIAEDIIDVIKKTLQGKNPDLVVIEGLAFMAKGTSLVQLSGLNYLIRVLLVKNNWPFLIVFPTTLKKFITGSGKGDKDMIMMTLYKDYGHESLDNNEGDAYGLSVCGLALLGKPLKKMTAAQTEVTNLLKKQL